MNDLSFLDTHASAFFGILGVIAGAILTFMTSLYLRKREYHLRLWEKILDRRIHAHEVVINCALEMRVMRGSGRIDASDESIRIPNVMSSPDVFEDFFTRFATAQLPASTWLSTQATREVHLVQDYLVTLYTYLHDIPADCYADVGLMIRQDFVDMSSSLEKAAYAFFQRDITRLSLSNLNEWHKYPSHETEKRLRETALLQKSAEILALRSQSG